MNKIEAIVIRNTVGIETIRRVRCEVLRLADAANAVAIEMGFPSWHEYSDWCESPPILRTVRVIRP